jgi:hypothetical protein
MTLYAVVRSLCAYGHHSDNPGLLGANVQVTMRTTLYGAKSGHIRTEFTKVLVTHTDTQADTCGHPYDLPNPPFRGVGVQGVERIWH